MTLYERMTAPPALPAWTEPRRPHGVIETIEVGDVTDDGGVYVGDGDVIIEGSVWMSYEKAMNAAYYGWKMAAGYPSLLVCMSGAKRYKMAKGDA